MKSVRHFGVSAFLALVVGALATVAYLTYGAYRDQRRVEALTCTYRQIASMTTRVEDRVAGLENALVNVLTPPFAGDSFQTRGEFKPCTSLRNRLAGLLEFDGSSEPASRLIPLASIPIPRSALVLRPQIDATEDSLALRLEAACPAEGGAAALGCRATEQGDQIAWVAGRLSLDEVIREVTAPPGSTSFFRGHLVVGPNREVLWQSPDALPDRLRSLTDLKLLPEERPASPLAALVNILSPSSGQGARSGTPNDASDTTSAPSAARSWKPLRIQIRDDPHLLVCHGLHLRVPPQAPPLAEAPGKRESRPVAGATPAPPSAPNELTLCGVLPESRIDEEASVLRSEWLAPALTLLSLLLAAFPLLKIWTMGECERLAARDIRLLVGAAFIAAGLVTFVFVEGIHRRSLEAEFDGQLEELATRASDALQGEIHTAVEELYKVAPSLEDADASPSLTGIARHVVDVVRASPDGTLDRYYLSASPAGSERQTLERIPPPGFPIDRRRYFQDVRRQRFLHEGDRKDRAFTFQIAASKTTGLPLIIVAKPLEGAKSGQRDSVGVLTLRPNSFSEARLPKPFGFAVVTREGDVLLHSDATRNESENLADETDAPDSFRAALWSGRSQTVSASYGARPHRFLIEQLPELDLAVVTFYGRDFLNTVSWEVFGRWAMLAGPYFLCGIAFILVLWLVAPRYRAPWLWPDREKVSAGELLVLTALLALTALLGLGAFEMLEIHEAIAIREGQQRSIPLFSLGLLLATPLAGLSGIALRVSLRRPLARGERIAAIAIASAFLAAAVALFSWRWILHVRRFGNADPLRPWGFLLLGLALLWCASTAIAERILGGIRCIAARPRRTRPPAHADESDRLWKPCLAAGIGALGVVAFAAAIAGFLGVDLLSGERFAIAVGVVALAAVSPFTTFATGSLGERLPTSLTKRRGETNQIGSSLDPPSHRSESIFRGAYAAFLTALLGLVAVTPSFVLYRNARSEVEAELSRVGRIELGRAAAAPDDAASCGSGTPEGRDCPLGLWATSWLAPPLESRAEASLRGEDPPSAGLHGLVSSPRPLSAHIAQYMPEALGPLTARLRASASDLALARKEHDTATAALQRADRVAKRTNGARASAPGDPFVFVALLAAVATLVATIFLTRNLSVRLFALDADVMDPPDRSLPQILAFSWMKPSTPAMAVPFELDLRRVLEPDDLTALLSTAQTSDFVLFHGLEFALGHEDLRGELLRVLRAATSSASRSFVVTSAVDPIAFLKSLHEEPSATRRENSRPADQSADGSTKRPAPTEVESGNRSEFGVEIRQWSSLLDRATTLAVDLDLEADPDLMRSDARFDETLRTRLRAPYASDLAARSGDCLLGDWTLHQSFDRLWMTLDRQERLTLIHLQEEGFVNPARKRSLRRLMERGLVNRVPTLEVTPRIFGRYVETHETRATIRRWETDVEPSAWSRISKPLTFAVGAVALLVLSLQGETETHAATIIGALAAAVPTLLRIVGLSPSSRPPATPS